MQVGFTCSAVLPKRNSAVSGSQPFPSRNIVRRMLSVACLSATFMLLFSGCEKKEAPPPPTPPEVLVADVVQQNVPIFEEWVAQLNGPVNADITPKVQG